MTTAYGKTMTRLEIRPSDKTTVRRFINDHHRHNEAPHEWNILFAVGLYDQDELVGVATAGRPGARNLCDGYTLEINRTCLSQMTDNGNSRLYGALCRAAKALGYLRVVTYTLQEESGSSLKAAGFSQVADVKAASWSRALPGRWRYDENLFGDRKNTSSQDKYRWERAL